jgi:PAS domain S-box-containing protein
MNKLNSKQAFLYALIVFLVTIIISIIVPSTAVTISGMLVTILLTLFIPRKFSTFAAAFLSATFILVFYLFIRSEQAFSQIMIEFIFILILIVFASAIIIYAKNLYGFVEQDKIQLASLFANATEGIILTDGKGVIVRINPSAEIMFGYEGHDLIGEKIEVLIPSRFARNHPKLREGFMQNPHNRSMGQNRDLYATKKNGDEFPVEVSLSHYKQGGQSFVIAFIVDIAERKKVESNLLKRKLELEDLSSQFQKLNTDLEVKVGERTRILQEALQKLEISQLELNEALDKEKQLNEIKSRFVSMASHEFRTPLSTVLSSASLISKYVKEEEQEKRDRHINRIKDSVTHLNEILEDFLSLGKLDEGKIEGEIHEMNLNELLSDTQEDVGGLMKKDQQIICSFEGDPKIRSDKKLLKNILINLVSNAIKFSPEGAEILLNAERKDHQIEITVQDQGIGISIEDQEHLFSSFFRGSNAVNIQGSGLGLHIIKRYIDLLNGTVSLQSELNKGTTVTVIIPV